MRRLAVACMSWLGLIACAQAEDVHVAVAANFLATAQTLAERFEAQSGDRVLLSSGSTGKLYAQIHQGAPFDVFLAADAERPRLLEQQGLAVSSSRFTYALGKLVLWSREPLPLDHGSALGNGRIRRLAIANPKTAPYGQAAQQTLTVMELWDTWQGRVVRGENVGQTLQYAATGNVDAAFVALAQVRQLEAGRVGSAWVVPQAHYDPIEQQAVRLRNAPDRGAATRFLQYLQSESARAVIEASGYGVTSAAP